MPDSVATKVVFDGFVKHVKRFTNSSDGSGESDVLKVDKSGLTGPQPGVEPGSLALEWIEWSIQGFTSVLLEWDHDTDDRIVLLAPGNGYLDFRDVGRNQDPKSAGGTGDVLLTTAGAINGATYDITVCFRKKQ